MNRLPTALITAMLLVPDASFAQAAAAAPQPNALVTFAPLIVIGSLLFFGVWKLFFSKRRINGTLASAVALLLASGAAIIWGAYYRQNHVMEGAMGFFGGGSQTYAAAGWALGLGVLAFLIGIGTLVAGLMTNGNKRSATAAIVSATKKCPDCAETIQAEAKICRFCGKGLSLDPCG